MDELKPGNKTKRKGTEEEKIGKRDLPGCSPSSRSNTSAPQPSPGTASSLRLPQDEAARWSSARHPIHRWLLDERDGGRRPPTSIKG
jgi:hypothetical protein